MKGNIPIEPTAEVIDEMRGHMIRCVNELERIAKRMRDQGDLYCAGEALSAITNCFAGLRLDLLAVRPIREYERISATKGEKS